MSGVGEQALNRECRRVLRVLAKGAILRRLEDGRFALVGPKGTPRSARIKISSDLTAQMTARGLLQKQGGDRYCASAIGLELYAKSVPPGAAPAERFATRHRVIETREIVDRAGEKIRVAVNLMESPLTFLHARGLVNRMQFEAGERLRADYTKAQMSAHTCVDLSACYGRRTGPRETFSDVVLAAKQRFRQALVAVGPGLADVVFDVCCALNGLEAVEKARSWPRSSAKVVLRLALDRLGAHYGLTTTRTHAPIQAWVQAPPTSPGGASP